MQWVVIVQSWDATYNIAAYAILVVILFLITVIFGIYPIEIRWTKRTTTAIGLVFIIMWYYELVNDTTKMIYISDIVRLFGVVLVILGPLGYLIPNSVKKAKQERKTQIIEI